MCRHEIPVSQGKPPRGPEWHHLASLGRTSKRDPAAFGYAVGVAARKLRCVEVRLCRGPFGAMQAYGRINKEA